MKISIRTRAKRFAESISACLPEELGQALFPGVDKKDLLAALKEYRPDVLVMEHDIASGYPSPIHLHGRFP